MHRCALRVCAAAWRRRPACRGMHCVAHVATAATAPAGRALRMPGIVAARARHPPSAALGGVRALSAMPADDLRKRVEEINEKFVEAREEIEYALEEEGTVYFEEEVLAAQEIAEDALQMWKALIADLPDEKQRTELQRSMGMKMEQLRAESQMMYDRLVEH